MHLFAQSILLTAAVLVATGVVILWLLLRSYLYFSRQKGSKATIVQTARPADDRQSRLHDAPDDVTRWQVAMHETARELSAQLDSKMSALQALIAEADRAAARLEAAQAGPSAGQTESERSESSPSRDRVEEICTLADYGYPASEIARRLGTPVGEVERILSEREQR